MTHASPDPRAGLRAAALAQARSGLQLNELTIELLEARRPVQAPQRARVIMLRRRAAGRHRAQPAAS